MKFSFPSPSSDPSDPSVYMVLGLGLGYEGDPNIETPSQLFVSHVSGSPSFVRKCIKSWITQGIARVGR